MNMLSAMGYTFSLFVRHCGGPYMAGSGANGGEWDVDDNKQARGDNEAREETEFSMIDRKEQENMLQWVRVHWQVFGKPCGPANLGLSPGLRLNRN